MTESFWFWFDPVTAWTWFVLAVSGVVIRTRRIWRLHRVVLPDPLNDDDAAYLANVKQSTYLRLGVKFVFLLGSMIAVFDLPFYPLWRVAVIAALVFMILETTGVDTIRDRLAAGGKERL